MPTKKMPTKLTIIRDPIHNYIPISHLEKLLIDDPLFQRLRHVTQNGLAYYVYPSNRTSRFMHSLGTMHIGGQMLRFALANTDDRNAIYEAAAQLIETKRSVIYGNPAELTHYLSNKDDPFYREYGFNPRLEVDQPKIILLQSLRLACVMHDLGHFPFSHTVEAVLSDFTSVEEPGRKAMRGAFLALAKQTGDKTPSGALHESIGRALTKYIFTRFKEPGSKDFALLCFSLAEGIASREPRDPLLKCLHSIVSGNLDADRCDYVRRDGFASAFEFGDFDLDRILHTLRFIKAGKDFELVPTTVAVSALEAFFLERYRIFRWMVFHPMVVELDLALSRGLTILLEVACDELQGGLFPEVKKVLNEGHFDRLWQPFGDQRSYDDFISCDEPWLLTVLRQVQRTLPKADNNHGPCKQVALRVYLDLVLDRAKSLWPLWKRQEDYAGFCKEVVGHEQAGKRRKASLSTSPQSQNPVVTFNDRNLTDLSRFGANEVSRMRSLEKKVQAELEKLRYPYVGILAKRLVDFNPYKSTKVLDPDANALIPLEDLSTIVRNLPRMWKEDMQLRVYYWLRKRTKRQSDDFMYISSGNPPPVKTFATAFANALSSAPRS